MTRVLLEAADLSRALFRIAKEIIEDESLDYDLVILGIQTRGVPLARRIAEIIRVESDAHNPSVGSLDIALFRDDQRTRPKAARETSVPAAGLHGKTVVLVDDVLYTGRSVRAALDALVEFGRPTLVRLAVLIDRGHREIPIRADFVGKNVPTSRDEAIRVRLTEVDGIDEVAVTA